MATTKIITTVAAALTLLRKHENKLVITASGDFIHDCTIAHCVTLDLIDQRRIRLTKTNTVAREFTYELVA